MAISFIASAITGSRHRSQRPELRLPAVQPAPDALAARALASHLLDQFRIIEEVFGHKNHVLDYTESGHVSRRQNLMRAVAS